MEASSAQSPPVLRDLVLEARLAHAEPGRRIVEVSAWRSGTCLGRVLGEGSDAEAAEERAIAKLQQRLGAVGTAPRRLPPPPPTPTSPAAAPAPPAIPALPTPPAEPPPPAASHPAGEPAAGRPGSEPSAGPADEPSADPDDWSEELAELDVQLQRLGWDRSQEATYLQRAFGHPSRNRLTRYADLVAYLRSLRTLAAGTPAENAPVPLRRGELLSQCDQLLGKLGWNAQRGRDLLERQFQRSSRQQLSDEQLLQFNMLLESEVMASGSAPAAASSPG